MGGKPLNFYCDENLMHELEAEAKARAVIFTEHQLTPQEMLRMAWERRPGGMRLARMTAKKGAGKR